MGRHAEVGEATVKLETNLKPVPSCFEEGLTYAKSALTFVRPHLQSPEDCQAECMKEPGCEAFTWLTKDSAVLPTACALFNSSDMPIPCKVRTVLSFVSIFNF